MDSNVNDVAGAFGTRGPDDVGDAEATLHFGRFSMLRHARQLLLDGHPCEIGSRAFDLLMLLIDRRGEIVTKREIFDRVWPETFVEDSNLRVQVNTLRRALGEGRDFVRNVPGRGYMFGGEVTFSAGPAVVRSEPNPPGQHKRDAEPLLYPVALSINFTRPMNAMVGRATELGELDALINQARLVTIVGSGGIGKTRLAIELGLQLTTAFPAGTWLIDLAPLMDRPALIGAVATALGVQLQNAEGSIDAIVGTLGQQQCLLIFDNCEHLAGVAAKLVDDLLKRLPALTVLATSQITLRIPAERVYRLNPLVVPPVGAGDLAGFSAVSLLVERARAADRRFVVTSANADGIAEICRRLDGVPLALEMAAARLPLLGVEGLRAGLDDRLKMLRAGIQTEHARHRTLRAMAEWSEGLLDPSEQQMFRRLGAFAGSFSLEAAILVAGSDGMDRWDIVDALGALVDKSLVAVESGEPPRYRLLETLRLFAVERLTANAERELIAEQHFGYFTQLFDRAYADWETVPDELWLDVYQPELDNARAALEWVMAEPSRAPLGLELATGVALLLALLRQYPEAIRYSNFALGLVNPHTSPTASARAFRVAGLLVPGDFLKTLTRLRQASDQFRLAGDRRGLAWALNRVGHYCGLLGKFDEADAALLEAHELAVSIANKKILAGVLMAMGVVASIRGDHVQARVPYERALSAARETKDERMEAHILSNFVMAEFGAGEKARALELSSKCLVLGARFGHRGRGTDANAISNHVSLLIDQDKPAEGRSYGEQVFLRCRNLGTVFLRHVLLQWVLIGLAERNYSEAARLWGFIDATSVGYPETADPIFVGARTRAVRLLEANIPHQEREIYILEGGQWTEDRAADFAAQHLIWRGQNDEQSSPTAL